MTLNTNDLFGFLGVLMFIVGIGFMVRSMIKTGKDLGEMFMEFVIKSKMFWLNIFIISIYTAEALYVAGSSQYGVDHPRGELPFHSKFLMHWSINMISFVIQISTPMMLLGFVTDFFTLFDKKHKKSLTHRGITVFLALLLVIISMVLGIGCPGANLYMLGANTGELPQIWLWWKDLFTDMREYYANTNVRDVLKVTEIPASQIKLGANYDPYSDLGNNGKVMIVVIILHYFILTFEGLYYIYKERTGGLSSSNAAPAAVGAGAGSGSGGKTTFKEIVETILKYCNLDPGDVNKHSAKLITEFSRRFPTPGDQAHATEVQKFRKLYNKCTNNWATMDQNQRTTVVKDINDLVSIYGIQLPQNKIYGGITKSSF